MASTDIMRRVLGDLGPLAGSLEDQAIYLDEQVKARVYQTRRIFCELGPMLWLVRERSLYSLHPQRFASFEEWLSQPEIGLSLSRATDAINWYLYGVPAIEQAGLDIREVVDQLDESKVRMLVHPIKKAAETGQPMAPVEVSTLIQVAAGASVRELKDHLKPPGTHHPSEDPLAEPEITFRVTRQGERYRIEGEFSEEAMLLIEKRLRPTWIDPRTGQVLRLGERS